MQPIVSVRDLCSRLGVRPDRLRQIGRDIEQHYQEQWRKVGSKTRRLDVPRPELKSLQRRINRNILAKIPLVKTVYGGVPGGSPSKNAGEHAGQNCVVNMDVKEFFPNVRHYMVLQMFRELGFGREVASLLTRLTTYRSYLPQGAPTSTAVANLLLADSVDTPVSAEAERRGWRYSRFVDDIAISGDDPRPLINLIARLLSSRRLPIHRAKMKGNSKLKITPRGRAQAITGLIVNAPRGLSVPGARRERVRAAIYALRRAPKQGLAKAIKSARGKIAHVAKFNPGTARRLSRYLDVILQR
jgi:hypothetical protein